jgi:carbon storage regulator
MLVITRRKGQRITIGDDIEIVVTAVHKSGIKLGIQAPRGYTVLRGEVRDAIFSANREASLSSVEQAAALATAVAPARREPTSPTAKLGLGRQRADASASQPEDASTRKAEAPSAIPVGRRVSSRAPAPELAEGIAKGDAP